MCAGGNFLVGGEGEGCPLQKLSDGSKTSGNLHGLQVARIVLHARPNLQKTWGSEAHVSGCMILCMYYVVLNI